MENCPSRDDNEFFSCPNWSQDDENVLVKVLVEEFVKILSGRTNTLIAQILLTLGMIPDESWNRVANIFNERTGKNYTKMGLKKKLEALCQSFLHVQPLFGQRGFGSDFPRNVSGSGNPMTPEGKRVEPEYGCGMCGDYIRQTATPDQANNGGSCRSGDNNASCHVENVRNSNAWNGGVPCSEEDVKRSNGSNGNVSCPGENVKSPKRCNNVSSPEENGSNANACNINFPSPVEDAKNSNRCKKNVNAHNGSGPSPEEVAKNSNGCNVNVYCPGEKVKNSNRRDSVNVSCNAKNQNSNGCNNVLSPGQNVTNPNVCNGSGPCPKEDVKRSYECNSNVCPGGDVKSTNRIDNISCPGENVQNSDGSNGRVSSPGKNQPPNGYANISSPRGNFKNSRETKCNTSYPDENVNNFSGCKTSPCPQANAKHSPRCESSNTGCVEDVRNSKRSNKRPFGDPATSSPAKRNYCRFGHSRTDTVSGVNAASGSCPTRAPDSDESYSIACCLNILNGMVGVDPHLYITAVDLFKDPDYRKFFVQSKNEKRLGWLKAMRNLNG